MGFMNSDWPHRERERDRVIDRLVADGLAADGPCLNGGCQEWARTDENHRVVERGCENASCRRFGSKR